MFGRTRLAVPMLVSTNLFLATWTDECRAQARINRGNATPPATRPDATAVTTPAPGAPAATPGGQAVPQPGGGFAGMMNDPANRLRMLRARVTGEGMGGFGGGGRGGRGGGNQSQQLQRPGGLALMTMLGESKALQDEIGLTDEQKATLTRVQSQARDRRNEAMRQMRENRGQDRRESFGAMQELAQQSESAIENILTDEQKRRLWEIELQIIGVLAVARPDVLPKLNLSPSQQQQVALIMQQMKTTQDQSRQVLRDQMAAMFGGRGGPQQGPGGGPQAGRQVGGPQQGPGGGPQGGGGPGGFGGGPGGFGGGPGGFGGGPGGFGGGPAGPQAGQGRGGPGQQPGQPQQPGQGGRGGIDREQMAARMQKIAEDEDNIRKAAEKAIAKVLTAKQKQRFNELLGDPFDLLTLIEPPQQGGGNRGGGRGGADGGAPPANATPTANRSTTEATR